MTTRRQDAIQVRGGSALDTLIVDDTHRGQPDVMDSGTYLSMFLRHKWIMLAVVTGVLGLGMLYTFTRPPVYEASAKIVVIGNRGGSPVPENDVPLLSDLQALTRSRSVETQVEIISSPGLLQDAFDRLEPAAHAQGFRSSVIPDWAYKVRSKQDTDIIQVTGRAYEPAAAALLANTISDTYLERDVQQNSQATRQVRQFAEEKMQSAQRELSRANADLARFKQESGLFAAETQLAQTAQQMATLSQNLDDAKAQLAASQRRVEALRQAFSSERADVVTNTTVARNPQFEATLQRIDQLNSERASLLQEYTPESREVRSIDNRIKQEEARLKKVAETIVSSKTQARNPVRDTLATQYATDLAAAAASGARARALQAELNLREQAAKSLPERERGLVERVQRVAVLQRTYDMLSSKYYALLLREQATLPTGMLVSKAETPREPAYPDPARNAALFLALGVMLAIAVAMIAERRDNRIHDQAIVEQLSGLPTLSIVPNAPQDFARLPGGRSNGPLLESYRILRNNISFSGADRQLKVIAITSPGRREGKSTTSVNLAVAMAMEGKRVLLVDGDMRRPSLHAFLDLPHETGLSTVIGASTAVEDAIFATKIENVFCMPAGPASPNAAEILAADCCREMFRQLSEQYDAVLIDCPPTTGLSDVQAVSTFADGLILVVSMNQTLKPHLHFTIRMLMQANAPLIGLVLNRIGPRDGCYGYYYDYCSSEGDGPPADTAESERLGKAVRG